MSAMGDMIRDYEKKIERYEKALNDIRNISENDEDYSLVVNTQEVVLEIIDKVLNT